jgi:hypothetical protein
MYTILIVNINREKQPVCGYAQHQTRRDKFCKNKCDRPIILSVCLSVCLSACLCAVTVVKSRNLIYFYAGIKGGLEKWGVKIWSVLNCLSVVRGGIFRMAVLGQGAWVHKNREHVISWMTVNCESARRWRREWNCFWSKGFSLNLVPRVLTLVCWSNWVLFHVRTGDP